MYLYLVFHAAKLSNKIVYVYFSLVTYAIVRKSDHK